jgi:hypothetical protein
MTHISYLTPQKLFQINGEYFAFRTYKNRTRLFKKMLRMSKDQTKLTQELISLGFITEDGHFNLDAFTGDPGKVRDRMNSLKSLIQNDKTLQKYFKNSDKVLKMLERYERMNKLLKGTTWIFSAGYRTQEWIKDRIADATLKKFRQKVGERWLARIAEDNIMGPAIKQWMEGAGVQALFRGVVEKVLLKIGFKKVGGLIFNAIAGAATGGLSTLFFWGFKIFAQIGVLMLVGLVFFLLSGVSFTNKLTTYAPVSYAMPGEVEQCSGFQPENLVNPDLVDIEVPPPSNSSCPFGDIYLACTQGYNPPRGNWSHSSIRNKKPVDLANGGSFYFYAPQYCDDGGCRVTGARPANLYRCLDHNKSAGDEVFFNDGRGNVFIIVHAKALVPIQQEVSGGQAVAYIYGRGELPTGSCWSGPHVHLEITHNGQYIDPLSFLQAMGCSVPSESQCTE